MIETETIRNLEEPPFVFGLRADYFVPAIMICSAILILSLLGIVFLAIVKNWLGMILALIIAILLIVVVLFIFRKKSIIRPFKELNKVADVVSHINLIDITDR